MKVYLIRHAHAVDEDGLLRDEQRYLSARGRRAAREVGHVLHQAQVQVDAILTSPLVRAVQTAELLADMLDFTDVIEVLPALVPGVPPRLVATELAVRGAAVAVIGHEPSISSLGALLVGIPAFPPMRPAQVSLIEDGRPQWFIHPETLAKERLLVGV